MFPVSCFKDKESADQAVAWMNEKKIPAKIHEHVFREHGPVHVVYVKANMREEAVKCVEDKLDEKSIDSSRIYKCPSCGSLNLEFPAMSQNSCVGAIAERLTEVVDPGIKSFFCHHCNYTWR